MMRNPDDAFNALQVIPNGLGGAENAFAAGESYRLA